MKILITGCAGFIGFHLSNKLLKNKHKVYGVDNLNNYYDVKLKQERLNILKKQKNFYFSKIDICNKNALEKFFKGKNINIIIHLAAQAGVRYSVFNPEVYLNSNINGFFNILELSKKTKIKHLIFASSSSVYGSSAKFPLKENFKTDSPKSFYSATKKSNEIMAYSYASLYKIPITCARYFTVYGPYGRPDMSLFKFTQNILKNKKIDLYNYGNHERDFTYIDDAVEMTSKLIYRKPKKPVPYDTFNISNSKPMKLKKYLQLIERSLNKKAKARLLQLQMGDVHKTHGSNKKIIKKIGKIKIHDNYKGIKSFVNWYKNIYQIL